MLFRSPAPLARDLPRPKLTAVRPDGEPGVAYILDKDLTVCGKVEGEILFPDDPLISARHAQLLWVNGKLWVEDVNSQDGTFLRLRTHSLLELQDLIRIGRQRLRLDSPPTNSPEETTLPWGQSGHPALLVQILEGNLSGETFPLKPGENLIGRRHGDIVFSNDGFVSSKHAKIEVGPQNLVLTDLASANGTFIRINKRTELHAGDQILLGMQLLRVDSL